jgi:hypothetical protein
MKMRDRLAFAASHSTTLPVTFVTSLIALLGSTNSLAPLPLLNASLAALLLTAVLWPVKAIVRRRYAQPALLAGPGLSASGG